MNREVIGSLAWGVGIVLLALAAKFANQLGHFDDETVTRLVIGATGLMIAWFGNRMPKAVAPSHCARQLSRVGGWSLAISGLIYAGLWAFAPLAIAKTVGTGAVAVGMMVTLGYGLWLRGQARARA